MPATPPALVVLAAGLGSRYGGLKQLEGVGPSGETLLEYSVYDALKAGFGRIIFVIRQDLQQAFRQQLAAKFAHRVVTDFAYQELDSLPAGFSVPAGREKPWGTAHAVLVCRPLIEAPFAVINADDFYGRESYQQLAQYLSQPHSKWPPEYGLVAYQLSKTLSPHGSVSRGICGVDGAGYLEGITERTQIVADELMPCYLDDAGNKHPLEAEAPASMNLFGFTPTLFNFLESQFQDFLAQDGHLPKSEFYLPQAVATMIRRRQARVKVLHTNADWWGITYAADRTRVQEALAAKVEAGEYPTPLWG